MLSHVPAVKLHSNAAGSNLRTIPWSQDRRQSVSWQALIGSTPGKRWTITCRDAWEARLATATCSRSASAGVKSYRRVSGQLWNSSTKQSSFMIVSEVRKRAEAAIAVWRTFDCSETVPARLPPPPQRRLAILPFKLSGFIFASGPSASVVAWLSGYLSSSSRIPSNVTPSYARSSSSTLQYWCR